MLGLSCITACVSVCVCMPIGLVAVLLCGGSFGEEGAHGLCHAGPEDGPHCQACGDCELSMMCLLLLTALPTPALLNAPPAAPPPPHPQAGRWYVLLNSKYQKHKPELHIAVTMETTQSHPAPQRPTSSLSSCKSM